MIHKVKQKIRNYLTIQHDADYVQQLEQQVISYHTWILGKEREVREREPEIIWDLQEKVHVKEEGKTVVFPYSALNSLKKMEELLQMTASEKEIVILAMDAESVLEESRKKVEAIFEKKPFVKVVYGDEDEVNHSGKIRMNPWLKPDYSPDTLLSYFYFGNLVAVRKECLERQLKSLIEKQNAGIYLKQKEILPEQNDWTTEGKACLYALMLEICIPLKREQIYHEKSVLTSSHNIRYWGFEEQYKEIREYYDRIRAREEAGGVSIIIPSKDNPKVLERCIQSIIHWTKEETYEIIVVDNGSNQWNRGILEELQKTYGFIYLYHPMEFNFSVMCNRGAEKAQYELLLFLNDDCEVTCSDWLSHMMQSARVQNTGAVGVKLYYPESKRIQHCGIYNIHVGPVHKLQFKEDVRPYYDRRNKGVRNVLAVTAACLMIRKSVFENVHGFDEELQVAFNDVDLCYKLYEAGYNNVVDNEIYLWHHESFSRGSDESPAKLKRLMEEKQKLYQRHKELWEEDPYYHKDFTTDILDTGYSFAYEYPKRKQLELECPVQLEGLPKDVREDACVVPMIEYAGDVQGWFLEPGKVKKIEESAGTSELAYLQGNIVVLGSDNACFEKYVLLRHRESGTWYRFLPEWLYRPDIFMNLQDQKNVALSGFACLVNLSRMPKGNYEVAVGVKDKISKQTLIRTTTRSVENR